MSKSKLTRLARWKPEAEGLGLDGTNTGPLLVFTNSGAEGLGLDRTNAGLLLVFTNSGQRSQRSFLVLSRVPLTEMLMGI